MFCLRIWLLPLFFLSSAPPLYLLLFLSATYILQRPCVYCSLLLLILVLALFDFSGNWFEPPASRGHSASSNTTSSNNSTQPFNSSLDHLNASTSIQELLGDGVALLAALVNDTATALIDAAATKLQGESAPIIEKQAGWLRSGWLSGLFGGLWSKWELRIPCVNAVIRL